mgnify:FL=1
MEEDHFLFCPYTRWSLYSLACFHQPIRWMLTMTVMNHDNDFAAVNYYVKSHRIYALMSGKHLEQHWYQFVPKALQSTAYFVIDDNFAVRRK